jgi:hypothetical protein
MDVNGCVAQETIILEQPIALEVTTEVNDSFSGIGTIEAFPNGGIPPYTFAWSNGSTSNSIEVPTGFYSIILTDSAGCVAEADGLEIAAGINEATTLLKAVFPNPFETKLEIRTNSSFTIYNAIGQAVQRGFGMSTLDTSAWDSGLYYYIDTLGNRVKIKKN